MSICKFNLDTFEYNIDSNLEAMYMPTPKDLYGSLTTATGAIKAIDEALHLNPNAALPTRATVAVGGVTAAAWAGAVLGSAIMAANRATTCNKAEMERTAKELGLWGDWIDEAYNKLDF
ncbi:hypothetical protein WAX88_20650 (plasmid) [Photobacterium damselae subsp. damselae]|uniref:hypothetical protein n=1 Tax=Photobacterium damselae TaxID=38293 RepID=UPI00311AD12E